MRKILKGNLPQVIIVLVTVAVGLSIVLNQLGISFEKKSAAPSQARTAAGAPAGPGLQGNSAAQGNSGRPQGTAPAPQGNAGAPAAGTAQAPAANGSRRTVTVLAHAIALGNLSDLTKLHGDVVSFNETRIYPNLGGTLLERKVSVGDRISRGTTIALVDPSRPGQSYLPNPVESTVAGTVLSIPVHEGDTIGTGTVIATIGNLERVLVATAVPERFIANLSPGTRAEISFDALPGQKFDARIVEMSPIVDAASRTLDIKLALDRQDGRVLAGMFATIRLVTENRKNVLIVPRSGVTLTSTGAHVFVISAEGKAERRPVELGLETENAFEVKKGLAVGERIVTEGKASVSHGDMVRVLDDSAPQSASAQPPRQSPSGRPSGSGPGTQGGGSQR